MDFRDLMEVKSIRSGDREMGFGGERKQSKTPGYRNHEEEWVWERDWVEWQDLL